MSKKTLKFVFLFFLTLSLAYPYEFSVGGIPPLGKFLSPFQGFWNQAEPVDRNVPAKLKLSGLKNSAEVVYDDRLVPHIFANNDQDLYYLQGYVTAQHRLFQMDLQTRAAGGRLSEIIGEKALKLDREARRLGIVYGAENSVEESMGNAQTKIAINSYCEGVNAFIENLEYKDYPIEYKLLDFKPEKWTPIKIGLLLKYMSRTLTGYETDFEYTNIVKLLGYETFRTIYPEFPDSLLDPIIPIGTSYPKANDSILPQVNFRPDNKIAAIPYPFEKEASDIGSNNWAVSGSRTESGKPILCNDPHLSLNLPSIWFELQLHSPEQNVYGVSLPGSPCVIIGYNDSIAWGTTNAARDVKDWYDIEFKDNSKSTYLFDGEWKETKLVVEEIEIKGSESFLDSVYYTIHGPIAHDQSFYKTSETVNRALRWTAHDSSNELFTFYLLNKASNYNDYNNALTHYRCPGQNFVFASAAGDIAIRQQGKFVHRAKEQGRFIMDGTTSATLWAGFIPDSANPQIKNPEQGWLSSANQHPTDATYPYYYSGTYEHFRNRRINQVLASLDKVKTEDMIKLQTDNFNLYASEILPELLQLLESNEIKSNEQIPLNTLREWIFYNDPEKKAPVYFETWWTLLQEAIWDEFKDESRMMLSPGTFQTIRYIQTSPNGVLFDDRRTQETESLSMLANSTFHKAIEKVEAWQRDNPDEDLTWANYKSTKAEHLTRLNAFSLNNLQIGGNYHIVNATGETRGPAWRMIISPGAQGQAFGVYPGGQSGNPGSKYYDNFIENWSEGKYYPLLLLKPNEQHKRIIYINRFTP